MAAKSGAIDSSVTSLWDRPFEYEFFQAVRLLQRELGRPVGRHEIGRASCRERV